MSIIGIAISRNSVGTNVVPSDISPGRVNRNYYALKPISKMTERLWCLKTIYFYGSYCLLNKTALIDSTGSWTSFTAGC